MKPIIGLIVALSLAACSAPRAADYADAASTAAALSGGAVELNPLLGVAGNDPLATAGAALVLKTAGRSWIDTFPEDQQEQGHHIMDSFSIGATCNNLAVIASAANPPVAGVICGLGWFALAQE